MSKKRVLMIAAALRIGGAEKVAADIGLYADPARYEIHYVVFGDEIGAYEPELEARGCRVFHMPEPSADYAAYLQNLKALQYKFSHLLATYKKQFKPWNNFKLCQIFGNMSQTFGEKQLTVLQNSFY